MSETRTCPQCDREFTPKAKHQIYDLDPCRYQGWIQKEVEAAQADAQRVEADVHPLAEARARQEQAELKSKLSQIIYQGIVDRLKLGPVHADDLEGLFPEGRRSMCRRLVGAQFGSLASRGYIVERERRKSKVKSRKGAKSGVYVFTKKGRETLVGHSSGGGGASSDAAAVSGESGAGGLLRPSREACGVPENRETSAASPDQTLAGVSAGLLESKGQGGREEPDEGPGTHSGEIGLTGPDRGAGTESPQGSPGSHVGPPNASTAPPDNTPTGVEGESEPGSSPLGSDSPSRSLHSGEEPQQLFATDPPSQYDPYSEAA